MVQQRLLEVAIREFGAKGLDGASTRAIAAAAGTVMSSITYHYGGKEGLYLAAADYIAAKMADRFDIASFASASDPRSARAGIVDLLHLLVDKLMIPRNAAWSLFIVREQMNPTEAFERLYSGPMGQMLEALIPLVALATGTLDDQQARCTVVTLFGQVLVMRAAQGVCTRLLMRAPDEPGLIRDFKARIAANTHAILDQLSTKAPASPCLAIPRS